MKDKQRLTFNIQLVMVINYLIVINRTITLMILITQRIIQCQYVMCDDRSVLKNEL